MSSEGSTFDDHFVDTNVVIGYTVEWDGQSHPVNRYLDSIDSTVSIYASRRVFDEAASVVRRQRRLAKQIARLVFREFGNDGRYITAEDVVDYAWKRLVERDDIRRNALSAACNYVRYNRTSFTNLAKTNADSELNRVLSEADDVFSAVEDLITDIRRQNSDEIAIAEFRKTKWRYSTEDYDEYERLDALLENTMDRDVLMDAYHLLHVRTLPELLFVSTDCGDVLDNSDEIERILSNIHVRHPGRSGS